MPIEEIEDALAYASSSFKRDLMQKLLERGYRVQGQVGSAGYRIDMVVEGLDRRRLAVECDGDRTMAPSNGGMTCDDSASWSGLAGVSGAALPPASTGTRKEF